jgi:hypothetical protein
LHAQRCEREWLNEGNQSFQHIIEAATERALPLMSLISPNLASDLGLESRPPPAAIMASADKDEDVVRMDE